MANFTCLAAARGEVLRQVGWDVDANGLFGAPQITVLIGDDAHTTVFSALQFLGLGHDRVVRVRDRRAGPDRSDRLRRAAASTVSGPVIAILQAGQINTGAFDDFAAIIPLPKAKGAWVHVDGAFGLWAQAAVKTATSQPGHRSGRLLGDRRPQMAADARMIAAMPSCRDEARPSPRHDDRGELSAGGRRGRTRSRRHYVPELSRRARGFATWAMIKHLGRQGIAAMVEQNCSVAEAMANRLRADNAVAIENNVVLNQFLVRFGADQPDDVADDLTRRTIAKLQADGVAFSGGAKWRGRQVMRVSVTSWLTNAKEGERAADAMIAAWRAVR